MVIRGSFFKELLKIQRRLWRNAAGRRFAGRRGGGNVQRKILLENKLLYPITQICSIKVLIVRETLR